MNCKKAEEIITTSIDGELEPGLEEQLADHLESCPRCKQEYEQGQHFKWMVRDRLNRVPAPVHLKSQIKAAIRTIHAPVSWRQHAGGFVDRYPRQIAGAMAAMLLVTFSLFTWQYNQPHNPPVAAIEQTCYLF